MKTICFIFVILLLPLAASAESPWIHQTEAQVVLEKGKPISKTVLGTKAIYRWNDEEISFTDGIVTSVTARDLNKEDAIRKHNAKRNAEHWAKVGADKGKRQAETE